MKRWRLHTLTNSCRAILGICGVQMCLTHPASQNVWRRPSPLVAEMALWRLCSVCWFLWLAYPAERRRNLSAISARAPSMRAAAERQAISTLCQGSAADIVKAAMNHLHAKLELNCSKGKYMRLVLQIHDELLFECDKLSVPVLKVCAHATQCSLLMARRN